MKTAIYIDNGRMQVVLTPETEFEKNLTKTIADAKASLEIMEGEFYECQGGWTRHSAYQTQERSLIIVLDRQPA